MANMPFVEQSFLSRKEILMFPDEYQGFAQVFDKSTNSDICATVNGRKVIKAGTIYPANDETAKGVVLYDVDVEDGAATGTVIFEGAIKVSKIPAAPTSAALRVLTKLKFFKGDGTGMMVPTYMESLDVYDVTFNANTGSGSMSAQHVLKGVATPLTKNTFTKASNIFDGWNTAANGSGTAYADEAEVTLTADLTLYAQWKAV